MCLRGNGGIMLLEVLIDFCYLNFIFIVFENDKKEEEEIEITSGMSMFICVDIMISVYEMNSQTLIYLYRHIKSSIIIDSLFT